MSTIDAPTEMVVVTKKNTNNKKAISAMDDELISCKSLRFFSIMIN